MDQTFYLDHYSKFGYGLGHELRYMFPSPSRGTFRTYLFRRSGGGWRRQASCAWRGISSLRRCACGSGACSGPRPDGTSD